MDVEQSALELNGASSESDTKDVEGFARQARAFPAE